MIKTYNNNRNDRNLQKIALNKIYSDYNNMDAVEVEGEEVEVEKVEVEKVKKTRKPMSKDTLEK